MPKHLSPIGKELWRRLKERRLTQAEFSKRIYRSQEHVRQVMHGKRRATLTFCALCSLELGETIGFWENLTKTGLQKSSKARIDIM